MKNFKEYLFEMPRLIKDVDFGLSNIKNNQKRALELLNNKAETLEENDDYIILRSGNYTHGYIALINKQENLIEYFVQYVSEHFGTGTLSVTQVNLWRMNASKFARGITQKIFFEYLLKLWPAIVSDAEQTIHGRNFWQDRMADAVQKGYHVGVKNYETGEEIMYNRKEPFHRWLSKNNKWSPDQDAENWRYYIKK